MIRLVLVITLLVQTPPPIPPVMKPAHIIKGATLLITRARPYHPQLPPGPFIVKESFSGSGSILLDRKSFVFWQSSTNPTGPWTTIKIDQYPIGGGVLYFTNQPPDRSNNFFLRSYVPKQPQ